MPFEQKMLGIVARGSFRLEAAIEPRWNANQFYAKYVLRLRGNESLLWCVDQLLAEM
jgi:hypothetical protein